MTVSPCVAATMKIAENAAWNAIANQGVFHFGCVFAKIGGRYRSRPPHEEQARRRDQPGADAAESRERHQQGDRGARATGVPAARPALVIAWLTPEMIEISLFGSAQRSEIVPSR